MASVVKRVSQWTGEVMLYAKVPDGKLPNGRTKWKMVPTHKKKHKEAQRFADDLEAKILAGQDPTRAPLCSELFEKWEKTLTNRSAADDKSRLKLHIVPVLGAYKVIDVDLAVVMKWIDEMREKKVEHRGRGRKPQDGKLSDATIRHCLNLLSRFFSWCVTRGHVQFNPVRQIPVGERPRLTAKKDQPWIEDDAVVRKLAGYMPEMYRLMFLVGNRSALRPGETLSLRLSDLDFLDDPNGATIRVRFSHDGPLKEDKYGVGKVKTPPCPDDLAALLKDWAKRRKAEGAGPEDYLFPYHSSRDALSQRLGDEWHTARAQLLEKDKIEVKAGFYQGTRHSATSRSLSRGASLDEVSEMLGHASPVTTQRHYNHMIRKKWSKELREGLGMTPAEDGGKVLNFSDGGARDGARFQSDETEEIKKATNP